MGGNMFGGGVSGGAPGQQPQQQAMPNPYARFNSQPAYSANNFIGPQIQSSYNLRQQAQNDPASTLGAFSPAAFQQMLSNFYPSNMTKAFDPTVGGPSSGANVLSPFNAPAGQPQQTPENPAIPPTATPAQPQGAPNGLFIPEWGRSISPAEVSAMGKNVSPEIQKAMQTYMGNLNMPQGPELASDPWVKLNWNMQNS